MRAASALLLLMLIPALVWASEETGHGGDTQLTERPAKQSSRDVKIPRALVSRLEREYRDYLTQQQVVLKDGIKRKLINVSAEMTQKRPVALHENVRVVTPLGGGVIDLAEFVTPLRGGFQLKLKAKGDDGHEMSNLRVFFVSQAKPRILAGEEFGAGCGKFMEITTFYNDKMSGSGFELFSSDRRYASVLGGTFVLVNFEKESLGVASVSFTDSRYPELFCE
jgi:hypothetical protein